MYESPITIIEDIRNGIEMELENNCLKTVYKYGIEVNKEELIKALKYDRDQYEKGYQDCMNDRVETLEKALDIAIKELCFSAKGSDACNPLEVLYVGIKERLMEQARKEGQE